MNRSIGIVLAAALLGASACRGDEDTPPTTNRDGGTSTNPDAGTMVMNDGGTVVTGDCPMGQGSAFTVCELKLDGNPRQPPLGDPIEVADVVVTTTPFSITQTATSGVNGFYVQDRNSTDALAGRYSGIVVTYFPDSTMSVPARGDIINITGTFRDFGQMGSARQKQIQLASFTANGTDNPTPRVVEASNIATGSADAVPYEGVLVEVQNVTAIQTRDIPGSGGSSIFGAFQVTGGLVVRNLLSNVRADMGESFNRIAGILSVGTAPFDAGIFALLPRDTADVESSVMAVRSIPALQDPMAAGRPSLCTQRGGVSTRMGTCPRVRFDDVAITAVEPGMNGRATLWVQDTTVTDGRFAGIRVFNARIEGMGTPTVGDRVNVEGIAVVFFDAIQIDQATATLTGNAGTPPTPVTVMPTDIPGMVQLAGNEIVNPYEGVLVRLENVAVTNRCVESNGDRGYFEVANGVIIGNEFDYTYNGGVPMDPSNPGPCSSMPRPMDMRMVGDQFMSISGVMDYSFNQFRLNPRSDADLVR